MPEHPEIPSQDRDERVPDPQRIIDRIINGRLSLPRRPGPGVPSGR